MLTDWLRTRRSRFVFFLLCSPLLIPLLCASIPILCAAEIFSRLRSRHPWFAKSAAEEDDLRLRRCEEGCGCGGFGPDQEEEEETGLLQRYLEDQWADLYTFKFRSTVSLIRDFTVKSSFIITSSIIY
ncbi:unnamed protein product [Arabis nemorensis]|uniref:Uncharacterized protein n=1 Tax=Arabis nemorensis TaxID=586526 RepID=A0A565B0K5_9BRAS|nr:unnamed protein product [Arabis nemorensis]